MRFDVKRIFALVLTLALLCALLPAGMLRAEATTDETKSVHFTGDSELDFDHVRDVESASMGDPSEPEEADIEIDIPLRPGVPGLPDEPETPKDPIALKSVNIQLGSSLSINFNGLASVLDQYEDVYVIFTAPGKDPVKVAEYFTSDNNTKYNFAYEGLTILDMNLQVSATVYGTYDGVEYVGETKSISMLYYCNAMIPTGNVAAAPCANLLKYAIAAEAYQVEAKGVDTAGHLVNVMTEAQKAAMEQYAYADSAVNVQKTSKVSQGTRVAFTAQALDMVSRITLMYKMQIVDKTVDTSKLTFKVTYTDVNGNPASQSYTFDDLTYLAKDDVYVLSFSGFYATQMRNGAKCTVYIDGVEHASYENSIENYCYTAINSTTESDAVKYLAKRISLYGDACKATFG